MYQNIFITQHSLPDKSEFIPAYADIHRFTTKHQNFSEFISNNTQTFRELLPNNSKHFSQSLYQTILKVSESCYQTSSKHKFLHLNQTILTFSENFCPKILSFKEFLTNSIKQFFGVWMETSTDIILQLPAVKEKIS